MMTKSHRLNLFLKKILSMPSRHEMQTNSSRISVRGGLSFSSSKFSRESSSQRNSSTWSSSCRSLESTSDNMSEDECPPDDVPAGCLAVYVGKVRRRFVIPTAYLSNRIFRALLAKSEEEYGLRCEGGLRIACSPDVFEHFLWWLQGETTTQHCSEELILERTCSGRSG